MARKPSVEAHEKVLNAAIELISERGIEATSMDSIAERSGVSKATIYKHWKDKEALCLDVAKKMRSPVPEFRSGDPKRDLLDLLRHLSHAKRQERFMKLLPRIISYATMHPEFGMAVRSTWLGPAEQEMRRIIGDARSSGRLEPETDPEIATSLLFGPIFHRKMMGGVVPEGLPEKVVDSFWRSWGSGKVSSASPSSPNY